MAESEAKKKWDKEHTIFVTFKLNRNTDADIVEFVESVSGSRSSAIKEALRQYIKNSKGGDK